MEACPVVHVHLGDGSSNQFSGDLQPVSRPEPEIIDLWSQNVPDRPPNLLKKVWGEALHLFKWVWKPIRPI